MTELVKDVMREQFTELKNNMTEEQEYELYNSEQYKLTTDQLVDQLIAGYDQINFFDSTDAAIRRAALDGFDQAIESTIMTKELEEEIFSVDQYVLDYLDRLVEALKIVKEHYATKFAA